MKVLVTGGYGFIGSFVAEKFYREGHEVHVLDNLSTGKRIILTSVIIPIYFTLRMNNVNKSFVPTNLM